VLVPYLAALMLLTFSLAWGTWWRRCPPWAAIVARPLHLWGTHALKLYLFHLGLVAVGTLFLGRSRLTPAGTAGVILCIAVACTGLAFVADLWKRGRAQR